jgi:hypothetical protein
MKYKMNSIYLAIMCLLSKYKFDKEINNTISEYEMTYYLQMEDINL